MAHVLKWNDREIKELEEIGRTVPSTLPCGTVVAYDPRYEAYFYDPNFGLNKLNHYVRSSHGANSIGRIWIAVQPEF